MGALQILTQGFLCIGCSYKPGQDKGPKRALGVKMPGPLVGPKSLSLDQLENRLAEVEKELEQRQREQSPKTDAVSPQENVPLPFLPSVPIYDYVS